MEVQPWYKRVFDWGVIIKFSIKARGMPELRNRIFLKRQLFIMDDVKFSMPIISIIFNFGSNTLTVCYMNHLICLSGEINDEEHCADCITVTVCAISQLNVTPIKYIHVNSHALLAVELTASDILLQSLSTNESMNQSS